MCTMTVIMPVILLSADVSLYISVYSSLSSIERKSGELEQSKYRRDVRALKLRNCQWVLTRSEQESGGVRTVFMGAEIVQLSSISFTD
jgi:hypothetical protein